MPIGEEESGLLDGAFEDDGAVDDGAGGASELWVTGAGAGAGTEDA